MTHSQVRFFARNHCPSGLNIWATTPLLVAVAIAVAGQPVGAEVPLRAANATTYRLTVNSDQDGAITPDAALTLREAIALTNGDLAFTDLSEAEQQQVEAQPTGAASAIDFDLPTQTIRLITPLPPLRQAGLMIHGRSPQAADAPLITLMPDQPLTIPMGLVVMADNIEIQGLQFQGFHSTNSRDYPFVGSVVVTTGQMLYDLGRLPDVVQLSPPLNVRIEGNQFGDRLATAMPSAVGVVLFEAASTKVVNNQFFNHSSSGILTGKIATDFHFSDNLFVGNGNRGIGDGVHLEGKIDQGVIQNNRFCQNHGAGVFLFKPEGAIAVEDNLFYGNGFPVGNIETQGKATQTHIAAVYLMGSHHQVTNNQIVNQNGAGVVIAAYPRSEGNLIQDNTFSQLQGLSIDLVTRASTGIHDYQSGDGIDPLRNSHNRRLETGNSAVNAPRFVGHEFFPFGDRLLVSGIADPNVTIDLYRVIESGSDYGPLNEFLTRIIADETGKFELYLAEWEIGDRLAAIATDSYYGTSEPSENAVIRSLDTSPTEQAIDEPQEPTLTMPNECLSAGFYPDS